MRIAFVLINANRFEGTSRAVVEVAERLASRHDVHLFSRSAVDVDLSKINWHPIQGPAWPDVAEFEVFRRHVENRLKHQQFDIVHAAGCVILNADVYAIQTVHPKKLEATGVKERNRGASLPRRFTRWLYDRRVIDAEQKAYRSEGRRGRCGYLPVSSGTERELRSCYPIQDALVEVIPNGADLEKFRPSGDDHDREQLRRRLDLSDEDFVVLFAGGEWQRKGLRYAIEAVAMTRLPEVKLVVAGTDPRSDDYHQLARDLGIEHQIRWLGFRSDIDQLYAAADVFIFPSAYEAFSLATIEAASAGLPVLMCDVSGAAELVGDGLGGRIVKREAGSIADALTELACDVALRDRLGREAREKVERRFNWDLISQQTESFYQRLVEARRIANVDNN